jgi:hypothetical protein
VLALGVALGVASARVSRSQDPPRTTGDGSSNPPRGNLQDLKPEYESASRAYNLAALELRVTEQRQGAAERELRPLYEDVARLSSLYDTKAPEVVRAQQALGKRVDELKPERLAEAHSRAVENERRARDRMLRSGRAYLDRLFDHIELLVGAGVRQVQAEAELKEAGEVLGFLSKLESLPPVIEAPLPQGFGEAETDPSRLDELVDFLESDAANMRRRVRDFDEQLVSKQEAERHLVKLVEQGATLHDRAQDMLQDLRPGIAELEKACADARARATSDRQQAEKLRVRKAQLIDQMFRAPGPPQK